MPKEIISTEPNDRLRVEVGWTRDLGVQLGFRTASDPSTGQNVSLLDEFYGDANILATIGQNLVNQLAACGRVISDEHIDPANEMHSVQLYPAVLGRLVLDVVQGAEHGMADSLWVNPDRGAINRLIRALRKARDAAFGRDE